MNVAIQPDPSISNLAATAERAKAYGRNAKSAATRRAYAADLRDFEAFCLANGLMSLPAEPTTVALYLTHSAEIGKTVATIRRRLAAIADAHEEAGVESPVKAKPVRAILSGIAREKGVASVQKAAITIDVLKDALLATSGDDLRALRDRAILLVGFHGALRRSEIAGLDVADLRFEREGVVVTIRRSKTDQEGAGVEIGLPRHPVAAICPVRALSAWLDAACISIGPVFRTFTMQGALQDHCIDGRDVARTLQRIAKVARLTGDIGGHSLRAGFITSAAKAGVGIDAIARVSRHKSVPVLLRYVRRARIFEDAPQLALR